MAEKRLVYPHSVLTKKAALIEAIMDDAIILLSLENSRYYGGSQVAADVWSRFDGVRDIRAIANLLGEEYAAPAEAILADITTFAEEMIAEGLLEFI